MGFVILIILKSWLLSPLEQNIVILDFNYICKNI